MSMPGQERRLAAVLAADMVGFSRLMEVDEAGTLIAGRAGLAATAQTFNFPARR